MAKKVLTHDLSEPLGGATTATFDFNTSTGNLTIDRLSAGEQLLASGTLEYIEGQEVPTGSANIRNGEAKLALKASGLGRPSFRFPWQACNGATEWRIHINPKVSSDITAHSGGGNVRLDLAGTVLTRLSADTGGGNMDIILPEDAKDLNVIAKSGAGNVTIEIGRGVAGVNTIEAGSGAGNVVIRMPTGLAARVQATSGMGKVIVDPCYGKLEGNTYQSPDYDSATDKAEIILHSGAGNVIVETK